MGEARGAVSAVSDVQWSGPEIHLRQSLSEEPIGDELSEWQQVSSGPAEPFAHRRHGAPGLSHPSFPPAPLINT